jgi:glycerol-3-phosphate dehydrogenase (NAD(P)+)
MVARSHLVLTTGRQFCMRFAAHLNLRIVRCPVAFPPLTYYQLWHDRSHAAAPVRWLREQVREVARGLPTAVTLAARDEDVARALAAALGTQTLRLYHSTDMRGVEIGGAAKNVLAIACGIAAGRGLGASANAALIARGFAELSRYAVSQGARAETLMGLSGLGDLVLTCSSTQSRNFSYGLALGKGETPPAKLAEGALTAPVLCALAQKSGTDMPIARAVADILSGRISVNEAIGILLARPQKAEG